MRIAIQNPHRFVVRWEKSLHAYNIEFLDRYASVIYLCHLNWREVASFILWIWRSRVKIWRYKIVFSTKGLNKVADVLLNFNGRPDLDFNCPPKDFQGLKIAHLVDHSFYAGAAHRKLKANGVDYVMPYNDHAKYDGFFRHCYPDYIGKCIAVPFSYASRFIDTKPFAERINKCVALGSVNLVDDPQCPKGVLDDYVSFWRNKEKWAHKFRHMIAENMPKLKNEVDSFLPASGYRGDYDIVETYNDYAMFTTCESIMFFPSVKTFEGCACGSAFVCSDHECYTELGFKDGVNCIRFKQYDIDDFKKKIAYYQQRPKELAIIAHNGHELVTKNYNPQAVAKHLYHDIAKRYETRTKSGA